MMMMMLMMVIMMIVKMSADEHDDHGGRRGEGEEPGTDGEEQNAWRCLFNEDPTPQDGGSTTNTNFPEGKSFLGEIVEVDDIETSSQRMQGPGARQGGGWAPPGDAVQGKLRCGHQGMHPQP